MLSEEFISGVCGPPLSSNTAIAKHNGLYRHTLRPTYAVKSTFKNSQAPSNCVAVTDSHVFAAQHEKAYVHVYSRLRGNQEAFVPFPERIRCVAAAGDVLVVGTEEGRLMMWETCTGRLISTPPRHVQAVSCIATTPYHIVTGSDDSNVHVWLLAHLLELDSRADFEPERTLSNHRAGITAVAASHGVNPDTSFCVSASRDRSCIVWNYQSGEVLRTLLFTSPPLCIALDPAARALFVSTEDAALYLAEFFSEKALLGPHAEDAATVIQVMAPFGAAPAEAGPATCLAVSYDGTVLLTGHPKGQIMRWDVADRNVPAEVTNLNAAVTNLVFIPPFPNEQTNVAPAIVRPSQAQRNYTIKTQLTADLTTKSRFNSLVDAVGIPEDVLSSAILAMQQPAGFAVTATEQSLQAENKDLWEIVREQREIQEHLYQIVLQSRSAQSSSS